MIDEPDDSAKGEPDPDSAADAVEPRAKSPWKAFILTGLIASLFGAAGGGYGVYAGLKSQSPSLAEIPNVDLSPIDTKLKSLTARLDAAEADVKKAVNRPFPKAASIPEPVDLSGLEKRLDALESAPSPEIDPAALTALKSAQDDGFDWPDTSGLETRLSELESKLAEQPEATVPEGLEARIETLEADFETAKSAENLLEIDPARAAKIEAIEARLRDLENRPAPAAKIERVSILAFPKDALIAAAEDNVEGGLFKKTLSRHVRVKDENDPIALIEGIEADIVKGRLQAAADKFERLPEPIRTVGQAWYESVKASL